MASSTISGPGSGYDTQAIVKALVGAEKGAQEARIHRSAKRHDHQIVGGRHGEELAGVLSGGHRQVEQRGRVQRPRRTSSEEKNVKVTLGDGAASGKYVVVVSELATSSKVTSKVFEGGASGKATQ